MAISTRNEDGKAAPASGIQVTNPVNGEIIGTVGVASRDDVAAAVTQARRAAPAWEALGVDERARRMRNFGNLLWENQTEAMRRIRQETGKNDTGAFVEVIGTDNTVTYYAQNGPRMLAPEKRPAIFPMIQRATVYRKPYGVVGIISPWNYPLTLAIIDAVPALIAGNTVVIKPSELTPFSVLYAVDLMRQAGIPQHVVQVVTGASETGAALVDNVDYLCFTGSTATGRKVATRAAEQLIPYSLELGGKDAMIVLDDADLDLAAAGVFQGACENAGQMCISVERVYIVESIYEAFVSCVKAYAEDFNLGHGDGFDVNMGSMTSERELARVETHIQDALARGAMLVSGGVRRPDIGPLFIEPAVLRDVDHTMQVMQEESFGPIIPIMKVADADEAVKLANDSVYGLSGTIFTRDLELGERLALRLDTGDIAVNRPNAVAVSPALPWGGRKQSGIGRRGGPEGLLRFTTSQSVLVDTQVGSVPTLSPLNAPTRRLLGVMRRVRKRLPNI